MKSKNIKLPFLLLLFIVIYGYSFKSFKYSDEDTITYKISLNKRLKIKLPINLSTGYKWFIKYNNTDFLDSVGYTYKPNCRNKDRYEGGVSGVACFYFKAKKRGLDSLEFIEERSFINSSYSETRKFYIQVD